MADDTAALEAQRPLLDAAATLASLAEPHKDLPAFGSDLRELAATLKFLGERLERAEEQAEDRYDRIWSGRSLTLNIQHIAERPEDRRERASQTRERDRREARDTAIRTAKRALVDLAKTIAEMERTP